MYIFLGFYLPLNFGIFTARVNGSDNILLYAIARKSIKGSAANLTSFTIRTIIVLLLFKIRSAVERDSKSRKLYDLVRP